MAFDFLNKKIKLEHFQFAAANITIIEALINGGLVDRNIYSNV